MNTHLVIFGYCIIAFIFFIAFRPKPKSDYQMAVEAREKAFAELQMRDSEAKAKERLVWANVYALCMYPMRNVSTAEAVEAADRAVMRLREHNEVR